MYASWCLTVDNYNIILEDAKGNEQLKYQGRGQALRFRLVPYLKENCTDDIPLRGGYSGLSRTWDTLSVLLRRLHRAFGKHGAVYEHSLRINLAEALGPKSKVFEKTFDHSAPRHYNAVWLGVTKACALDATTSDISRTIRLGLSSQW